MLLEGTRIGFIGGGAMAEALIAGFTEAGLVKGANIHVYDISVARQDLLSGKFGIRKADGGVKLVQASDVIILAVKPANVRKVLDEFGSAIKPGQLVISIAAGYPLKDVEAKLGIDTPVIRVMPNTPCLVGLGMSVLSLGSAVKSNHEAIVQALFQSVGETIVLPESLLEAATGLSGSGPAYIYLIIEAFIDAGVRAGIPRETARLMVIQTVAGAAKMARETGLHPGILKDMVTSPGGTTIAGLEVLENSGIRGSLINAVTAANKRAAEMAGK